MIKKLREQCPVVELCKLFKVNRATFYYQICQFIKKKNTNEKLIAAASQLFQESRNSIGSRRLAKMPQDRNFKVGRFKTKM